MTLTDKTGAPVTITKEGSRFVVGVEGQRVGLAAFADRDGQRVFYHTTVEEAFGGRGLATVLIAEALRQTRAEGLRIVAVCEMVSAYVKKHQDFNDILDRPTRAIVTWLRELD
ncbi:MAG: N-acetyltransferase [Mycobacterium sp.]|nr:N-acetyltransferase [Mycobacterium sp.]